MKKIIPHKGKKCKKRKIISGEGRLVKEIRQEYRQCLDLLLEDVRDKVGWPEIRQWIIGMAMAAGFKNKLTLPQIEAFMEERGWKKSVEPKKPGRSGISWRRA